MSDDVLVKVKRLKNDAKIFRDIGDTASAIAAVDEAIAIVEKERKSNPGDADRLKAELADCLGMKGGILRRANQLQEALQAYKAGLTFEVGDSYNLTNTLILELLLKPTRMGELKTQIEEGRAEVEKQIQSHRSRQWWAWADLGLLELLTDREDRALDAYTHFSSTGARASDYDSTVSVLEELAAKFAGVDAVVQARLGRAAVFLKSRKS